MGPNQLCCVGMMHKRRPIHTFLDNSILRVAMTSWTTLARVQITIEKGLIFDILNTHDATAQLAHDYVYSSAMKGL